jgi:hypothetical protein
MSREFTILNLARCVGEWNSAIVLMHTSTCTPEFYSSTRHSLLVIRVYPHGTIESNFPTLFSVKMWCGIVGGQINGSYTFPQRLTVDNVGFLQNEVRTLLDNAPLSTRL